MNNKIFEINKDIIWVQGANKSAIYNFNDENIYSLNSDASRIFVKYVNNEILNEKEKEFIKKIEKSGLISSNFQPCEKIFDNFEYNLNFAWLELTMGCNLKCVHCYEGNNHISVKNPLSEQEWKDIIKQLAEINCKRLVFIGGEPCLYKSLNELLKYASKFNFKQITLFTNATLINQKTIEIIKDNNIQIRFSLYGSNAKIHDSITQQLGSFDKTINNIKYLIKLGVEVSPAIIIMRENENDLENIKKLLESLNLNFTKYDIIRKVFNGSQDCHLTTRKDIQEPLYRTKPNFYADKRWLKISSCRNTCWTGKFAISPDGNVFPCEFERDIVYGNVKKQSLKSILDSDLLHMYWNLDFSHINICKDCEFRLACKDCRPLGKSLCGDILDKNPRCLYNPYSGEWGRL